MRANSGEDGGKVGIWGDCQIWRGLLEGREEAMERLCPGVINRAIPLHSAALLTGQGMDQTWPRLQTLGGEPIQLDCRSSQRHGLQGPLGSQNVGIVGRATESNKGN